jgi:L-Ala-D/L-Glu epimerase
MKWTLEPLELPLKILWKISRSESNHKQNFLVRLKLDDLEGVGEVAFNVRYGESAEALQEDFERFSREFPAEMNSVEQLVNYCLKKEVCASLRFGIESAFVDYLVKASGQGINELLGVPSVQSARTSFSLPIVEPGSIRKLIESLQLNRFETLKLKVNKESASDTVRETMKYFSGKIRVDGNECWSEPMEVIQFLKSVPDIDQLEFLEQPLKAEFHDAALELKLISPILLIADEALTDQSVTEYFSERYHGVNIKLMKAGSYLRAIRQLREARKLGLKTMLGCMIETSLGISSALAISHGVDYLDLDGCLLIEKDPFNLLHEEKGKLFQSSLH